MDSLMPLLSILLGGGFLSSLVLVFKARPEKDKLVLSAAAQATSMMDELNAMLLAELNQQRLALQECLQNRHILEKQLKERSA